MSKPARSSPRCIIIAGPNGAGKTTFAREFLSKEAGVVHFVNPDLIARVSRRCGRNSAALAAGRLFLRELDRLAQYESGFRFREHAERADVSDAVEALEGGRAPNRDRLLEDIVPTTRAQAYRGSG